MDVKEPSITISTHSEAEMAEQDFMGLASNAGWKRLVLLLDDMIKGYMEQLRSSKFQNINEVYRTQEKIELLERFRNTPEIIIAQIHASIGGLPMSFDPYQTEDEIQIDR